MTARVDEDETPDPRRLVALLADPARLRVYAALVLARDGGAQPPDLAAACDVPLRDVLRTLTRFEDAGLAAQLKPENGGDSAGKGGGTVWRATPETLRAATEANARQRDDLPEPRPGATAPDPQSAAVLRGFFNRGRLTHVPLAHAKRMIVLDYLAQSFEPGVRYPESEVNEILSTFHEDYAALRRYLVDADFMGRSENHYWRTGGSVGL
jgi:DNA-binding transcriptional ArsR family regulator